MTSSSFFKVLGDNCRYPDIIAPKISQVSNLIIRGKELEQAGEHFPFCRIDMLPILSEGSYTTVFRDQSHEKLGEKNFLLFSQTSVT